MDANIRMRPIRGFLVGCLITVPCWCVSAIAATGADIGCSSKDRRLQTLTVSVDTLAVRPVDHISVGAKNSHSAAESSEAVSKAAAPVLQLAPHIAAMLNTVFDSSEESAESISESGTKDDSPTAGRVLQDRGTENVLPMNAIVPSDDIARFQRQMYRKDI